MPVPFEEEASTANDIDVFVVHDRGVKVFNRGKLIFFSQSEIDWFVVFDALGLKYMTQDFYPFPDEMPQTYRDLLLQHRDLAVEHNIPLDEYFSCPKIEPDSWPQDNREAS